jgi:hypothetical protein
LELIKRIGIFSQPGKNTSDARYALSAARSALPGAVVARDCQAGALRVGARSAGVERNRIEAGIGISASLVRIPIMRGMGVMSK